MRWLLCVVAWTVANLAGLYVAAQTTWGPVAVTLSAHHGVHVGDLVAVLAGVAAATLVTGVLWATAPAHPARRVVVRWLLCAALWQTTMVASLFIAATTDGGPVVMRLWQGKPVHLGDVVAVLGGIAFAGVVTAAGCALGAARRAPAAVREQAGETPPTVRRPDRSPASGDERRVRVSRRFTS